MHLYPCASRNRTILLVSCAFAALTWANPATSQSNVRPRLTAAQCQPLTESNYELCCIARNRTSILTREQLDQCPPLTTSLIDSATEKSGNGRGGNGGGGGSGSGGDGGGGGNGG